MTQLLLIEDDLDLGAALQQTLQQASFTVVWVRRLSDGLAHAQQSTPDCIVLDLNLPDGDGNQLIDSLRQHQQATPILVLSARQSLDDRLRALNSGADDYLQKPCQLPELIARIHALIRRAAGQSAQQWIIGSLSIDPNAQTATIGADTISLTAREFAILRELATTAGRVVRRESLTDRAWRGEHTPSDGAIEFQIHALRRKLGPDRIHTVRGIGYLLMVK